MDCQLSLPLCSWHLQVRVFIFILSVFILPCHVDINENDACGWGLIGISVCSDVSLTRMRRLNVCDFAESVVITRLRRRKFILCKIEN